MFLNECILFVEIRQRSEKMNKRYGGDIENNKELLSIQ
jgi:hypothetical protein